ncbi:MAG: formate dehydrogenase accessory protein FdhE [Chloroflexi bacterium]|nr:formate dehydrogenase accessory protein FdhE [Chloroflexota bacterium]
MSGEVGNKVLNTLREWEQAEGHVTGFMRLHGELLQIQNEARSGVNVVRPNPAEPLVRDRLCEGVPLVPFEEFSPDWDEARAVFEQIIAWFAKDSEGPQEEVDGLREIARDRPLMAEIAAAWYRGTPLTDFARARGIDEAILASAVGASLKPFLMACSELLSPEVDQETWRRKYCPICGGKPDFAYLDKDKGARWLVCSRCDAEWLFLRLECPYCDNQDHGAMAYLTDQKESSSYRVYVCDQCHGYIKAIDLRRAEWQVLLPLERVVTAELDKEAQARGYKPGWADR